MLLILFTNPIVTSIFCISSVSIH